MLADDYKNLDPEEKKRELRKLQTEIVMFDSDRHKLEHEKSALEAEIRSTEMNIERLKIGLEENKKKRERVTQQLMQIEEEIKKARRKMNVL